MNKTEISENCVIYNDNCFDVLKMFPDNYIDLVLTDPPYGIDLTPQRDGGKFKNTKVINDNSLEWLPEYVSQIYRISKNCVFVFCGWQNIDKFKTEFERLFVVKNILIWDKDWFGMGNNYRPNYEMILLLCKTNIVTKSKNKSNILKYRRMSPQKLTHSCEKPVLLLQDLIYETTEENDIILDTFMGTGSCGEASKLLNRRFIGIELDENYFNLAKDRLRGVNKI